MKVNLSINVEDSLQLQRFLYDLRHSLSINAESLLWTITGVDGPKYDISQIVLMEDLQIQLIEAVDEIADRVHFAGCCTCF